MKVLLDTNAYTALRLGLPDVIELVRKAESITMSAVVVGELLFGFRYGAKFYHNYRLLEEFLDQEVVEFVPVTLMTCHHFGLLSAGLRRRGRPIPTNDVWIAAHSLETGSQLLTRDHHFEQVDGLPLLLLN